MALGIMEQLVHCSVRIEATLNGGGSSCGTGFFMNFLQNEDELIPAIVTNKHVISGAAIGKFHITMAKPNGLPDIGNYKYFTFRNFEQLWIPHPDPEVDLAVFLLGPLLNQLNSERITPFYVPLNHHLIPPDEQRELLSPMEQVVMIGYPNGIWDAANNLPVIRQGITATHPAIDWNGKPEFLTDIASFPGSSGSPVILVNLGGYIDKYGRNIMGDSRIMLLGIHYAGAMHNATGEIIITTSPTSTAIPLTQIPNNIGVVINSKKLLDFDVAIHEFIRKRGG